MVAAELGLGLGDAVRFYLGTCMPRWLWWADPDVPLCVSWNQLGNPRLTWHPSNVPWVLDSGGFVRLKQRGAQGWDDLPPAAYAAAVRRCAAEVGYLEHAFQQDWMCEPPVRHGGVLFGERFAGTGLTVRQHQVLTCDNYIALKTIDPALPIRPVLQGWEPDEHLRHADMFAARGIDLEAEPLIGVGSVCRLQGTGKADWIMRQLSGLGLALHGLGVKSTGLALFGHRLASSDSQAWSKYARGAKVPPLPGCTHRKCSNCLKFALLWRERVLASIAAGAARPRRLDLFDPAPELDDTGTP